MTRGGGRECVGPLPLLTPLPPPPHPPQTHTHRPALRHAHHRLRLPAHRRRLLPPATGAAGGGRRPPDVPRGAPPLLQGDGDEALGRGAVQGRWPLFARSAASMRAPAAYAALRVPPRPPRPPPSGPPRPLRRDGGGAGQGLRQREVRAGVKWGLGAGFGGPRRVFFFLGGHESGRRPAAPFFQLLPPPR